MPIPEVLTAKILLVHTRVHLEGGVAGTSRANQLGASRKVVSEFICDGGRNILLHREQISELSVICLRPDGLAVERVVQLSQNPKALSGSPDTAFDHGLHPKPPAYLPNINPFPLELKRGCARNNLQTGNPRKGVGEFIGQSVAEEFVLFRGSPIRKGQHSNPES